MVLAARALAKETRLSLDVAGERRQGPVYRTVRPSDLQAGPFQHHQYGRCDGAGRRVGLRRAGHAGAGGR